MCKYDSHKIVLGLENHTLGVWNNQPLRRTHVLRGHTHSVVWLQYNERIIVPGSRDSTVKVIILGNFRGMVGV